MACEVHVLLAMMRLPQSPLTNDSNLPSNFDLGINPLLQVCATSFLEEGRTISNPFPHVLPLGFGDPHKSLPELSALRFSEGLEEIWALTSSHWPALASQLRDRLRPTEKMLLYGMRNGGSGSTSLCSSSLPLASDCPILLKKKTLRFRALNSHSHC